jgi:hypothetical protein
MSALREYTQRQYTELETEQIRTGSLTTFRLPEVGLGSRLYLAVSGKINAILGTGTAVMSELGIRNLISRLTVRLNDGTILYEMQGFNTAIPTMLQNGFDPDVVNISRAFSNTVPFKAIAKGGNVLAGDNDFNFMVEVPFINNDKDMLGLLLLQNGTTQVTVEIQWNQAFSPNGLNAPVKVTGNTTATVNGLVNPVLETFTIPNLPQEQVQALLRPHLSFMNVWKSEYEALTSTAPLMKKLERGSIYTKVAHNIIMNGVSNSLAVSHLLVKYRGTETPIYLPRNHQLYFQRRNYGFDLPDGLFVHDYDRSFGIEEFGDMRDYIDSRSLTELVSQVNFDSTYNVGADSYVYTIVNKLSPVAI